MDELLGPVDRIQDPPERALGVCRRVLLADDAAVGEPASDELAETTLDRVVDVRDQRRVGLRLDLEIALDGRPDDPACRVGQLDGDGMVALDISSRDPGGRTGFHTTPSYRPSS